MLWMPAGKRTTAEQQPPPQAAGTASPAAGRPVYPYSVVKGGVYTPEEVERAQRDDVVVAAHYRGIGPRLRPVRLQRDLYAHVSYRVKNAVYWTRKRVRMRAGETVMSDGRNLVRARCGNRVSEEPQEPIREDEPTETTFEMPDATTGEAGREVAGSTPLPYGSIGSLPIGGSTSVPPLAPDLPIFPPLVPDVPGGPPGSSGGGPVPSPSPIPTPSPTPGTPETIPDNGPPYVPSAPVIPPSTPNLPQPTPPVYPPWNPSVNPAPVLPVPPYSPSGPSDNRPPPVTPHIPENPSDLPEPWPPVVPPYSPPEIPPEPPDNPQPPDTPKPPETPPAPVPEPGTLLLVGVCVCYAGLRAGLATIDRRP